MLECLFKKVVKVAWLLPGFLLWASFPPMGEMTDCLFAFAPLLWLARQRDVKTNLRYWSLNGLLFWVATLAWMPAIVKNGGPWPLVVLGWGALAAYCAAYFTAYGYLVSKYWTWVRRADELGEPRGYGWRLLGLLVIEPVLWAGLELVRARFLGGFAWNQLGVAGVNAGFGAPAMLGGVYLVSALIILVNGTIASIVERVFRQGATMPSWVRPLETGLPLLLVWLTFNLANLIGPRCGCLESDLRVGLVQRNFPSVFERDRQEDPAAVYSNLLQTLRYTKPQLLVLSESAMCEFGIITSSRASLFARSACHITGASALLAGGNRYDGDKQYNSVGLYTADTAYAPMIYDKVHLVPFGEFIPGDKWMPFLQKLAPVGSCTPGTLKTLSCEVSPNETGPTLGVAICYEDTDSAQMRRLAKKGANLLVFVTNDSWFSHSDEAVSHAWQAVARAIETGLYVVRVGNSGVTGIIDPTGKTTWLTDAQGKPLVDAAGVMSGDVKYVPCEHKPTFYVVVGDVPLFCAFLAILLTMGFIKFKTPKFG